MVLIARSNADRRFVSTQLRVLTADGQALTIHMGVSPLSDQDLPRWALVMWEPDSSQSGRRAIMLEEHLAHIAAELRSSGLLTPSPEMPSIELSLDLAELSERQREIVQKLLRGERVAEIARTMYLSPSTVRNHLSAVFRKFKVHSQIELIALLRGPRAQT
jgi:DNA-binding CsgD family transcriptional regulator